MPTREYSCSACDFEIRSENEDELVDFVQRHAEQTHDMNMAADEIRSGWRTV